MRRPDVWESELWAWSFGRRAGGSWVRGGSRFGEAGRGNAVWEIGWVEDWSAVLGLDVCGYGHSEECVEQRVPGLEQGGKGIEGGFCLGPGDVCGVLGVVVTG